MSSGESGAMPTRRLKRKASRKRSCANVGYLGKRRSPSCEGLFWNEGLKYWHFGPSVLLISKNIANASYLS
jgi:hypothetical protein